MDFWLVKLLIGISMICGVVGGFLLGLGVSGEGYPNCTWIGATVIIMAVVSAIVLYIELET